ncbi:MAG: TIGR03557 family F420-dependent LLM class oxidoreductase, partial [Chloroflexota bacterium]|nr:TIGR03557 family F420-dependent LLM class oxidoreductase [Chloroflexota bacterium]
MVAPPISPSQGDHMPIVGFVLSHEQFAAPDLVEYAALAERAGFDAVWASDHFHPWMDNEGHSCQAWLTLAAVGQRVPRIRIGTGVTCPTFRYHPAIVAQAFATLGLLYPDRVFLGLGTGEAVNEQAVTGQWPPYQERAERLVEAVGIIRRLWAGERLTHDGDHYQLMDAHLYDRPEVLPPIHIAASGPQSAELAGRHGDGLISDAESAASDELRAPFERGARAGGKDPASLGVIGEIFVEVGDETSAEAAARLWRFLPRAWDRYVHLHDPREIQRLAEKEVEISEVTAKFTIGRDPQVHIEAIR